MVLKLRKVNLVLTILEENFIPGFTGKHIAYFKGHFTLLCLNVLYKLPKAVAADVPMAEVEQVISDGIDLPAADFRQVVAVQAKDDIKPLFVSGNFGQEYLPNDLVEPLLFPFDLLPDQQFEGVEVLLDGLVAFIDGVNVVMFQLLEVVIELLHTDGLVVRHALLVAVVDALEAVQTDATVEIALIVYSDELVGSVVLVAVVHAEVHAQQQNCSSYAYALNSQSLLYRMHEPHERVEFFHSESSFGSESNLSESRYYDFTNELIAETDNVFLTLKRELLPNETQSQQEKIQYALRRAQILQKDTIPEHAAYLNKIDAPANAKQQVALCSEKLAKLLADHQKLKNGTMIYKQFYNVYGKQFGLQSGTFSRKKEALQIDPDPQEFIKPEFIQINYTQGRQKLTAATPRVFVAPPQNNNDKQLAGLREEVYKLKKTVEENKKKYQLELTNQQLAFEKRMRTYLSVPSTSGQLQQDLNEQLKQNSQKIEKLLSQNKELKETIEEKGKTIENLKSQNDLFKEQIEVLRKADSNMAEYHDAVNKSYNSQVNQNEDKKLQKLLKNFMQENELLKNQLKTQRQRFYRMQSDLTEEERRELQRNRKNLQKKRNELQQLYGDFDRQRIEILQLSHSCKSNDKMIESLRRQNQELKVKIRTKSTSQQIVPTVPTVLSFSKNQKSMQLSRASKVQILQYEGDGIEGFPYYDTLSKEFKIRFKRACLKEKQLLYKANGIQIGAISNFESPNKVNILVHLANYSENMFEKIKIKIMNANENKIQGNSFEYSSLAESQQIKLPITISIHQYPIGPLILLLEYTQEKKEEIRILLPAHIFKTMIIEERDDNINAANSVKLTIATERKICRDLNELKKYLKVDKVAKISLFNEHTHTLFYIDLIQAQNGIDLVYEHKEGSKFITEYFVKTFAFLVGKDTTR